MARSFLLVVVLIFCLVHLTIHASSDATAQLPHSDGSSTSSARNEEAGKRTGVQQQAASNLLRRPQPRQSGPSHRAQQQPAGPTPTDSRSRHRQLTERGPDWDPEGPAAAAGAAGGGSDVTEQQRTAASAARVADAAPEPLGTAADAVALLQLAGEAVNATGAGVDAAAAASLAASMGGVLESPAGPEAAAAAAAAAGPEEAGPEAAAAAAGAVEPVALVRVVDAATGQQSWQYVPMQGEAAPGQQQQQQDQEQATTGAAGSTLVSGQQQQSQVAAGQLLMDPQLLQDMDESTLFSLDQAALEQLAAVQTTADGRPLPTKSSLHKGHPKPGGPNTDFGNIPPGSPSGPPYGQTCDPAKGLQLGPNNICECLPGFGVNQDRRTCSACPDGWVSRGGPLAEAFCRPCPQLTTSNRQRTACVPNQFVTRPPVTDPLCTKCNVSPFEPPACCNRAQECCDTAGCCNTGFCIRTSLVGIPTPYCCRGPFCPNDTSTDDCCLSSEERCVNVGTTTEQRCCRPQDTCGTLPCCRRNQLCCNNACIERATSFCCGTTSCALTTQTCCNGVCCNTFPTTTTAAATSVCVNNTVCCPTNAVCNSGTVCCSQVAGVASRCLNNRCCPAAQICVRNETLNAGDCCILGLTTCTGSLAQQARRCCPVVFGSAAIVCTLTTGASNLRDLICCDSRFSRCPLANETQACIPRATGRR